MIYEKFTDMNEDLALNEKVMALDVGGKSIGVAISDAGRVMAFPKVTIRRKDTAYDVRMVRKTLKESNIKAVVVGLPLDLESAKENAMCKFIRGFVEILEQEMGDEVKFCFHDERLTSEEADYFMREHLELSRKKRSKAMDEVAASYILQSALDMT